MVASIRGTGLFRFRFGADKGFRGFPLWLMNMFAVAFLTVKHIIVWMEKSWHHSHTRARKAQLVGTPSLPVNSTYGMFR